MNTLDKLTACYAHHVPGLMNATGEFAVLELLTQQPDGLHLIFEVRAAGLRQGGEVCFPGGRFEAGEDAVSCALRETQEELGIPQEEIRILGMPDFVANARGYLVRPVLGLVSAAGFAALRPSPAEVAEVFTVPLEFFRTQPPELYAYALRPHMQPEFPYDALGIAPDYAFAHGTVDVPVWRWEGRVIWGLTARFTRDLVRRLDEDTQN